MQEAREGGEKLTIGFSLLPRMKRKGLKLIQKIVLTECKRGVYWAATKRPN